MTVTRIVAPRPWKTGLALFDQPTFEKSSLVPMPDSVSSFVELSINPDKLLDELKKLGPPGVVKAQIDDLSDRVKSAGQIDLRKDILGHLGPRMVAYLAQADRRRPTTTRWNRHFEAAFRRRRQLRQCKRIYPN